MARIRISLDDLTNALEDHCYYTHYYLDRETGEIIIQSEHDPTEGEVLGGDLPDPFQDYDHDDRFIPVEPMESRRGFDVMESFAAGLPDGEARRRLLGALSKRKPFRNFKDSLYDYPDIAERWHELHSDIMKTIAEEWLKHSTIDYELTIPGETLN